MPSQQRFIYEISPDPDAYEPLLDSIGDAHYVLLGEASHGTHEFYRERARITRLLVEQKNFSAVAVEADWPDCYRVNRYAQGVGSDLKPEQALADFARFPQWMWRNTDVVNFVQWLHLHNKQIAAIEGRVGFYGIDLYSLYASIEAVIGYLEVADPPAAARARERYSCFDHFDRDSQTYGMHTSLGLTEDCETAAVEQLQELRRLSEPYLRNNGVMERDETFFAEQNALVVSNAEHYYRSMFYRGESSWNIRDRHMAETVEMLTRHLAGDTKDPKIVIWAHNSHLGDARATDQSARGELNLGQLVREKHGDDVVAVGFSTYDGTVTASSNWDEPAQHKRVRPGLPGSYEDLFHQMGPKNFYISTDAPELSKPRLQRAIGVIYRPDTERQSHYYLADLPKQFDWMINFDRTHAVEPLEKGVTWHRGQEEAPEAYPTGL